MKTRFPLALLAAFLLSVAPARAATNPLAGTYAGPLAVTSGSTKANASIELAIFQDSTLLVRIYQGSKNASFSLGTLNSKGNIGGATVLYFFVGGSTPLAGNLVKSGSKYRVNLTYYAGPQIVTATSLMTRQT